MATDPPTGDPLVADPNADPAADPSKGEDPPKEPDKPEPKAPAEYAEFTVPEGSTLDSESATEFKSLAKELDLTQEQAQKLLDFGGAKIAAQLSAPYKAFSELQTKWQGEIKADPDIGGTKLEQSVREMAHVFAPGESNPFVADAVEAKALRDALVITGAGNNPVIAKLFVRMGRMLAEPGHLGGRPSGMKQTLADKMYPDMPDKTGE